MEMDQIDKMDHMNIEACDLTILSELQSNSDSEIQRYSFHLI